MRQLNSVKQLLVVDDELEVREALRRILQREGYDVEVAANAEDALTAVEAHQFDLVITDLVMPGMDGLGLLNEICQARPGLPVIILTAYGGWDSYMDAMNRGAFNYVTKPIKKDEIVRLVKSATEPVPKDDPRQRSGASE